EEIRLPTIVQSSPIQSVTSLMSSKGFDLLLLGNQENARLKIGRMDANPGWRLHKGPEGNWDLIDPNQTGLYLRSNVTSVVEIDKVIWIGVPNDGVYKYAYLSK